MNDLHRIKLLLADQLATDGEVEMFQTVEMADTQRLDRHDETAADTNRRFARGRQQASEDGKRCFS
jgi:hypothetical protein